MFIYIYIYTHVVHVLVWMINSVWFSEIINNFNFPSEIDLEGTRVLRESFGKNQCGWGKYRIRTSIHQPTNAHIISHKTLLKHFKHSDMFRSCQIIIKELCSVLKLYYSIHNSIRICKRGVVAAYHVVWESVVEQWLGVRRTTHT